jgi:tetratricopeptide (TPR) repeat protein
LGPDDQDQGVASPRSPDLKNDEVGRTQVVVQNSQIDKLTFIDQVIGSVYVQARGHRGPPLSPPFGGGGRSRLIFYGYDVDFFGRTTELEELRAFATARPGRIPDFAWWLWCGSGGQGKTRLAAEFSSELMASGWQCGFLPQYPDYKDWDSWAVSGPTFIVIDHLASRAENIRNAIACLSRGSTQIGAPLRILMLERPFDQRDQWVDLFIPSASPQETADVLAFAFRSDGQPCRSFSDCVRNLGPLAEQDLLAIVEKVSSSSDSVKTSVTEPRAVVRWLRDVDPEMRPLFLVLATRALCSGDGQVLRQWNRQDVVEAVIHRDFLLWQDTLGVRRDSRLSEERKLFEDHLTLILASTITACTDQRLLKQLQEFGLKVPERVQVDWVRAMTGDPSAGNERELAPLKPDIVGECFVLERCAGGFGVDASPDFVRSQMTALLSASLALAAGQTIDFVRRCISDFPQHEGLSLFASMAIPEGEEANIGHLMDYVVHFGQIANILAKAGREDIAEACWTNMISVIEGSRFAHDRSFDGMIDDYLATAYYNRGRSRSCRQSWREAGEDTETCIRYTERSIAARSGGMGRYDMERLRLEAFRLQAVVDLERGDLGAAKQTLGYILDDPTAISHDKAEALLVRATVKRQDGDLNGAIADLDTILEMGDESRDQQDQARIDLTRFLLTRSIRSSEHDCLEPALADLDRALPLVTDEMPIWAAIHVNRGVLRMKTRRLDLAEEDCTAVLRVSQAPIDQRVKALINRGQLRLWRRDWEGADSDIQAAFNAAGATEEDRAQALLVRAQIKWNRNDQEGACKDVRAALGACGAGKELFETAVLLHERYGCSRLGDDYISDFDR